MYETLLEWAKRRQNRIWSKEKVAVDREQWSPQQKRMELIEPGCVRDPPEFCHHVRLVPRLRALRSPYLSLQLLDPEGQKRHL